MSKIPGKFLTSIKSQRGDTIIEVVIAMAVLGLVLGASAVLVNRSSKTLQTSQENAVALRAAQKQIEYLQFYASSKPDELPGANQQFCMKSEIAKAASTAECSSGNGGALYTPNITLTYHEEEGGYYDANVTVRWDTLTGVPGSVELSQRVYKKLGAKKEDGGSCPAGFSLVGVDCVENKPAVQVNVRKIPPRAGNVQPTCSDAATTNRNGSTVSLTGSGASASQVTGSNSSTVFSGLLPGGQYNLSVTGIPAGYNLCTPSSVATGPLGAGTRTIDFKIYPTCTANTVVSGYTPVYGPWYNPIIRYDPVYGNYRWERGVRAGHPGYPNYMTDGWYGWNGNWTVVGPTGGAYFWMEWDGRTASGGRYWYNLWQAIWAYDVIGYNPVYGAATRDIIRYDPVYTTVRNCTP